MRSKLGGAQTKALVIRLDLPALLATIRARLEADLEVYQRCSPEVTNALGDAIARNLAVASQSLLGDAPVDEGELQPLWESAKHRYDQGVGVDDLLQAYGIGIQEVWRARVAVSQPGDEMALTDIADFMYGYGTRVTAGIAGAFLEVRERAAGERERLLRRLFDTIVANKPIAADELSFASANRFPVTGTYIPFAVSIPRSSGDDHLALAVELQSRAIIAMPEGNRVIGLAASDRLHLDPVRDDFITVIGPPCERSGLATSLDDVRLASETATRLHRHGLNTIASLASELLVARQPSIAQELIRTIIEPLKATGSRTNSANLLETVAAYFAAGFDHSSTAASLFIHPNTLDRRLQRITAITGLFFTNVADITRLHLALVASEIAEHT